MNKAIIAVLTYGPILLITGCTIIDPGYAPYTTSNGCQANYNCSACNTNYICSSGCLTTNVYLGDYNSSYWAGKNAYYTRYYRNYNNVGYNGGYWGSPHRGCYPY